MDAEIAATEPPVRRCERLQWGRALMDAEMWLHDHPAATTIVLQWGRALMDAEIALAVHLRGVRRRASMGPRPDGRGNERDQARGWLNWALQWGRALMDAEMAAEKMSKAME